MTTYLTAMDVRRMNQDLLVEPDQESLLIDEEALERVVMWPQLVAYSDRGDLIEQAAQLTLGIVLVQAFEYGNEVTALAAGATFLVLNGLNVTHSKEFAQQIESAEKSAVNPHIGLAAATRTLVEWLRDNVEPL